MQGSYLIYFGYDIQSHIPSPQILFARGRRRLLYMPFPCLYELTLRADQPHGQLPDGCRCHIGRRNRITHCSSDTMNKQITFSSQTCHISNLLRCRPFRRGLTPFLPDSSIRQVHIHRDPDPDYITRSNPSEWPFLNPKRLLAPIGTVCKDRDFPEMYIHRS